MAELKGSHQETAGSAADRFPFDYVAQNIFYPIYPVIAKDALTRTGIRQGTLADIGCGGGHLGMALLEQSQMTGIFVDISSDALALAEEHAWQRGLRDRCRFFQGDVHHLTGLEDGCAHLVVSRGSYHIWTDLPQALREIWRILAPGGRTYVGGGMGSAALAEEIRPKMQRIRPGWPQDVRAKSSHLTDPYLRGILDGAGIPHELIHTDDEGRWIMMKK